MKGRTIVVRRGRGAVTGGKSRGSLPAAKVAKQA
ncbi:hypothetical protein Tmar_1740 [Thermaerobacter marianensis DSM 12885]|uniref:Uncharacterized protein n=1 Tax=Thermaerobacter marianensis (strain ATCC 700841 / DSM 12885 / JCM 10246 / 7p75a) TaxID=644966 RepID=E6SHW4_THEM7|nr:hypothetical protein Tmar_1740 [Thermaerobacter marianensis DSM 12885]